MFPWFVKIPLKIVLSRTRLPHGVLNRIGVFRHGDMIRADYALGVVRKHTAAAGLCLAGKTVLELGPGDSVGNGIVAFAFGADRSILNDSGAWAVRPLTEYRRFVDRLADVIHDPLRLRSAGSEWRSFDEMLEAYRISYQTNGVESLRDIPSRSVDFCFSHAVLEHVRLAELPAMIGETRRVLRDGGLASHAIDYQDHLQASLNNLRFSRAIWESNLFASSGFYTNRLRHSEVKREFEAAGFRLTSETVQRWEELPIHAASLHPEFRHYSNDDLLIFAASLVVRA